MGFGIWACLLRILDCWVIGFRIIIIIIIIIIITIINSNRLIIIIEIISYYNII